MLKLFINHHNIIKNLIINKNVEDNINFNPLSKYDYESFKRIAFTNAYEKLQTNKADDYNNFRLKLYGRDLNSNEGKQFFIKEE